MTPTGHPKTKSSSNGEHYDPAGRKRDQRNEQKHDRHETRDPRREPKLSG
jgi:hypothetical protein